MNKTGEMILAQLGGPKFRAMTGAKQFLLLERGLQFDIPQAQGVTRVQVVLAGGDLYTMAFYKWNARKLVLEPVGQMVNGLLAGDLARVFRERTGLATSL